MSTQGSSVDRVSFARRVWRGALWVLLVIAVLYAALVIYRIPAVREEKLSQAAVAKIQAQKLTMDDVDGNHLPPPPDPAQVDATIAGVDANGNGIRDDVELAIFAKYPNSEKIRAAELQYAMELQNELTNVFDSETWVAVAKAENNGISCLGDLAFEQFTDVGNQIDKSEEWKKEVEELVFNTEARQSKKEQIFVYQTSFAVGNGQCDLNLVTFSN